MAMGHTAANLGFYSGRREHGSPILGLLLRVEAWLDRRRTSKELYELDDHALADIGLSRADVEGLNTPSWQDHLPASLGR
jgi:uncharacterized protein YjiS (DUF1127 family)